MPLLAPSDPQPTLHHTSVLPEQYADAGDAGAAASVSGSATETAVAMSSAIRLILDFPIGRCERRDPVPRSGWIASP